jgi:hypothetical protein
MSEGRKVAAILVADIVGYSRLMGEDEAGTAQAVSDHREAARPMTFNANDLAEQRPPSMRSAVSAVRRRRFPVGASPTRQPLQPEATGAVNSVSELNFLPIPGLFIPSLRKVSARKIPFHAGR